MASAALQIAVGGIQAVSPGASVITKLTSQTAKTKAQAIDTAIGKLFSNGISEEHLVHRNLRNWTGTDAGLLLRLKVPVLEKDNWGSNLGVAGQWVLSFENPRPSIFSDWQICPGVSNRLAHCKTTRQEALYNAHAAIITNSASVLGYELIKGTNDLGTIQAYISSNSAYTSALSSFSNDATKDGLAANKLCTQVSALITGVGLNGDDADIVVWAMINGMPWPDKMYKDAFKAARPDGATGACAAAVNRVTNVGTPAPNKS